MDRPESYGFSSLCQAWAVEAISFTIVSSEAFVVLAFTSTTLLQGSSMAGTTLTVYVGLTPSDAEKIFKEHQAVQPHWKDRLGLKSTALEARTRVVFRCHILSWNVNSLFAFQTHPFEPQMQAIQRCHDTDLKGGHIKEIGAHKVTFTTHGITHLVVF